MNGFRVLESLFESLWICCGLYKYQTWLIFFTTVTDPLSPLPTTSQVSGFLRPHQTQIYTILCCLSHPVTLKPRTLIPWRPELSPRHRQKLPIDVSGGLRKPETSLGPSLYIPNRIGLETDHKSGLISS